MYSVYKLKCRICGAPQGTLGVRRELREGELDKYVCNKAGCRTEDVRSKKRPILVNGDLETVRKLAEAGMVKEATLMLAQYMERLGR